MRFRNSTRRCTRVEMNERLAARSAVIDLFASTRRAAVYAAPSRWSRAARLLVSRFGKRSRLVVRGALFDWADERPTRNRANCGCSGWRSAANRNGPVDAAGGSRNDPDRGRRIRARRRVRIPAWFRITRDRAQRRGSARAEIANRLGKSRSICRYSKSPRKRACSRGSDGRARL